MTATTEPVRITAGDTIIWQKSLSDYPANDGWVLAYTLINAAAKKTVTAAASGADHLVTITAATSAAWAAGLYTWVATVTKAAERYTVGTGSITVVADLAALATFDARTSARKALDLYNLALETYGSKAYLQAYEINGRSQKFHDPSAFLKYGSTLRAQVASEDAAAKLAAGIQPRNQIRVRFGPRS